MKKNIKDINLKTEISLLNQKDSFERNGGIAACIKYENNFFFKDINLKGKNLIEFGCGIFPSSFGIEKNKMPKKYIASDTSKKILKIAKINDDRLVYKLIDLEKKIKQPIKYDVIVLKGVLHHTKNPEDILIKLKRILKPNGIILISEPNLSSFVGNFLKWLLSLLFNKNMEDSPYGQYNFKKISNSIKDANLKIYKKFIKKKIFHIKEIFEKDSIFSNTRCIVDKNDQVLRVQQKYFKSNLKVKKIEKIIINKKELKISADNEIYKIEKLVLCIGNLNLIDLLYKSELIFPNDIISYDDGDCSYVVNFLIDPKKNYYIPMPILNILEKLIFKKSNFYNITNSSFFLQKFNSITKKYKIKCKDLIENTNMNLRFFLSNHVSNLRINNIPIRKFLSKKSKRVQVFSTGTVNKYLQGPISQDLIFDIVNNQ